MKQEKHRTKKEISQEYSNTAAVMGHKARELRNLESKFNELSDQYEAEIKKLLVVLDALDEEGKRLPKEETLEPLKTHSTEVVMTEGASA